MRQVARKGLATVMATGGMLAAATGLAHADAGADGSAVGSPGVASGNNVQVPVHVPVNICGNTVNIVGVANPAVANQCANTSKGRGNGPTAGASAKGGAVGSPGVLSGNNVQVPVEVPVNICGNTVDVVAALNPAAGNDCANKSRHTATPKPHRPKAKPPTVRTIHPGHHSGHPSTRTIPGSSVHHEARIEDPGVLAATGTGTALGVTLPVGAALIAGGIVIYRRAARLRFDRD
jgi:ChpA-C